MFNQQREVEREMMRHRREVLTKVAKVFQQEKSEFYQKYRIFQLHKWEILKVVKQQMLQKKLAEVKKANQLKHWIVLAHLRYHTMRAFQIFDRERFLINHRRMMLPIVQMIKIRIKRRMKAYGANFDTRISRKLKSATSFQSLMVRSTVRERAKQTLMDFLQRIAAREKIFAHMRKTMK